MKKQAVYRDNHWRYFDDIEMNIPCHGVYKEPDGIFYYKNGVPHRSDGPYSEYNDGEKEWVLDDVLVYSNYRNELHKYNNLSEDFKQSIIRYKLSR
jgi:hypothetical protein